MSLPNPRFEDSYGRLFGSDVSVGGVGDEFFRAFYDRFLQSPQIGSLFSQTDMDRQIQMLKRSLFHLVTYYVTSEPSGELKRIAQIHAHLGVQGAMFDEWLKALLATVREFDLQADEATELAWAWALSPGITYMRLSLPQEFDNWDNATVNDWSW